jgi:exopolysaccharide biosynthesis polyprenyl glycosylphosphotransferase
MIKPGTVSLRPFEHKTILIVVDLIIVNMTTLLALWLMAVRGDRSFDRVYLFDQAGWFLFLSGLWLLSAFLSGFYDARQITLHATIGWVLLRTVLLIVFVYLGIYFFFAGPNSLPRGIVLYQGAMGFILIGLWHHFYISLVERLGPNRAVIIVGAGWAGQTIAGAIKRNAPAHYRIQGFVDDDPSLQGTTLQVSVPVSAHGRELSSDLLSLPILGAHQDLLTLVQSQNVPEIILAITRDISAHLFQALLDCKEQGVQITLMPVLFEELTGQIPIEHIGDNWNIALPLASAEAGGFYPIAKRIIDIVGALCGLSIFVVMLPFLAVAILLDSGRPIFYTQDRIGRGGKLFGMAKLRTMVQDAEPNGRPLPAQQNDERVTRVGRFLRRTHLDEMPQLINVLRGEMSAVGPRPERPEHLDEFNEVIPFHRLRNAVSPGMASWATINFGYVENADDAKIRLQYDLYYIKHQSLWLDLHILVQMFGQSLALRGR